MERKHRVPHLGMRIIKTGICVFFCLLLNYLFSPQVALYSSLAAIATMESTLKSTIKTSVVELVGTGLGGLAGMAILPLAQMADIEWLYVFIMPSGMVLVIYLCVVIKMPQAASLCGFVYIAVLVAPFDSSAADNPYMPALYRISDTAVGVIIAMLVNRFVAPPKPRAPKDVHVPANTFGSIYGKVRSLLNGSEQLVLLDTALFRPELTRRKKRGKNGRILLTSGPCDTVSIPVPLEYASEQEIRGTYVACNYEVTPFELKPHHGYVDLPSAAYPATVVWQTAAPKGAETYGIVHGHGHAHHHQHLQMGRLLTKLPLHHHHEKGAGSRHLKP